MTSPAPKRPVLVGTSWKMNKTLAEAADFVESLLAFGVPDSVEAFILPPHTALAFVRDWLPKDSGVRLGAQNAHWAPEGAFTGEVSMRMVRDAGATMVELGHSERRAEFGESDEDVARKVAAALDHDLIALVCVGESAAVRDAGTAESFVVAQVVAALARVTGAGPAAVSDRIIFAYEPIWAIGTSGRPAVAEEVAPIMAAIRRAATEALGGPTVRVLYGGSVEATNAVALLEGSAADGLFVGRAALSATGFIRLISLCAGLSSASAPLSTPVDREVHHAACR